LISVLVDGGFGLMLKKVLSDSLIVLSLALPFMPLVVLILLVARKKILF
jgi:hypothetical protein